MGKWLLLVGLLVTVLLLTTCNDGTAPITPEPGTVSGEMLGNGDASVTNQSFKLKQKLLPCNASSAKNDELGGDYNIEVYVNGILWKEASSFFGIGPKEQVYIVRQNDEGETTITFGDGIRGARLPTGENNIVANYRCGS